MAQVEVVLLGKGAAATGGPDFDRCREIRIAVFVEEQQVERELEFDGLDDASDHFLAFVEAEGAGNAGGAPRADPSRRAVGTARLRRVEASGDGPARAKVERVAVLGEARGRGVGRALMGAVETRARERGLKHLWLHAQVGVIPFYTDLGYRAFGDVFEEAGIDHREMEKTLAS